MQETWVWFMGWKDPLEKEIATHSSILGWRIPGTEEPGRLESMGSQRVEHDLATKPPTTTQMTRTLDPLSPRTVRSSTSHFLGSSASCLCLKSAKENKQDNVACWIMGNCSWGSYAHALNAVKMLLTLEEELLILLSGCLISHHWRFIPEGLRWLRF